MSDAEAGCGFNSRAAYVQLTCVHLVNSQDVMPASHALIHTFIK